MSKNCITLFIQIFILTLSIKSIAQDENRFFENGKWGYKLGTTVMIEPKFDTINEFAHGVAFTKLNNFYGAISEAGVEIAPCIYSGCLYLGQELIAVKKDGKWGAINFVGEEVIPMKYEEIKNRYRVEKYVSVKSNGMWGLIDLKDKTIIPCEYDTPLYGGMGMFAVSKNGLAGYINKKNQTVIPFQYTETFDFYNNIAEVYMDTSVGYIDRNNNIVIPIKFDYVEELNQDLIAVSENNKYGIWTVKGKELIKPVYTNYLELYEEGIIMVDSNDYYLFDLNGNLLMNEPSTKIEESDIYSEWLYFRQNGKVGIYDLTNQEIMLEAKYDSFEDCGDDRLFVYTNGKVGLYQISEGRIIVEPLFDEVEELNSELFVVKKDGLCGVIRKDGTYLLKIEYTSIWMEDKKTIAAESNQNTVYFTLDGRCVIFVD